MQEIATSYAFQQRQIQIVQKKTRSDMRRLERRRQKAAPPTPLAPLQESTIKKTLAAIDSHATRLFVILDDTERDPKGVIRITRRELAERMGVSLTTLAYASSILKASGLIQRIGKCGYILRARS
jgi:hypothetical protein